MGREGSLGGGSGEPGGEGWGCSVNRKGSSGQEGNPRDRLSWQGIHGQGRGPRGSSELAGDLVGREGNLVNHWS